MALRFVDQEGAYNENTEAVRFFALDGQTSIMFTISKEALEDLEEAESLSGLELQRAYGRHLTAIREVACAFYQREGTNAVGSALRITSAMMQEHQGRE